MRLSFPNPRIRIFGLVDTFRQVPCYSEGASFLVRGFTLCSFLKSGSARIALMRFALLNDASRWTLCLPNFFVVPRALGEFDGVIWPQFSFFPWNRNSRIRILRYTTQMCRLFNNATDLFTPLLFDSLLGCPSASTCRNLHFSPFVHPDSDL